MLKLFQVDPIFDKRALMELSELVSNHGIEKSVMTEESWESAKDVDNCTVSELLAQWIEHDRDDVDIWNCLIEIIAK